MLNIDLDALEHLVRDFYGELNCFAFDEIKDHPKFKELNTRMKCIAEKNAIITHLYEGSENALGHTITNEDLAVFKEYYTAIQDREALIVERMFCYGFILGSNLKGNMDLG